MKNENDILILNQGEVLSIVQDSELHIVEKIRQAYLAHDRGESSLPHSTFLTFPHLKRERIIGLPAYLGGDLSVAGLKWIGSFPENTKRGLDRASAVILLNSLETGRPQAILEGAAISAKRTAASAALAAQALRPGKQADSASFIGCGLINREICRFLAALNPEIERLALFDIEPENAQRQKAELRRLFPQTEVVVVESVESALGFSDLVSFATTAIEPHVSSLEACQPGAVVLHISLRDLTPQCLLDCDNVTDDIDHVCRANTSIHLAEQLTGSREFVRCTLAQILSGAAPARVSHDTLAVFSPFGLGVLDMAVAKWVCEQAVERGLGTCIEFFSSSVDEVSAV